MKRYNANNQTKVTEYSSIAEFLNDINSLPNNQFYNDRTPSSQEEDESGWHGTNTYDEAVELMKNGWKVTTEKISSRVKFTHTNSGIARSSKPAYGVVGSQASVPRYLQGIPTNMVSRQIIYSKQKVITITKGIAYPARVKPEEILEESIKAIQIIQSMENKGQRVRLNILLAVTKDNKTNICKICIKQPDERMSIAKMSFPLAHPSMLRRFCFKWIEVDPFTDIDLGYGYGKPSETTVIKNALDNNEYYLPPFIGDLDNAIREIENSVK